MILARRALQHERHHALSIIVAAFATDPLLRWVWPEDDRYNASAPLFFGMLLDLRRAGGEVWVADAGDGEPRSVSLWNPPGGLYLEPADDAWDGVQSQFTAAERERWRIFGDVYEGKHPAEPHWYLGVLATDPAHQGEGFGRAVVGPLLAAADRMGLSAALETASESNVEFYRTLGFDVSVASVVPDGPPVWLMVRAPQPVEDATEVRV